MKQRLLILLSIVAVVAGALALARVERRTNAGLPSDARADHVVIDKSDRTLTLLWKGRPIKTYEVALGPNPSGHKQQEGDGRTPEGRYAIDFRKADSAYHRALHISYPNATDRARAKRRGVSPGGDIMIHGLPNGMSGLGSLHLAKDWTRGCIAVTSEEIEQIWRVVPTGTQVEIRP